MIKPRHDRTAPVAWLDLFWAAKGSIALIAGAALLGLTLFSVISYQTAKEFKLHGEWTTAEIVKMRTRRSDDDTDYLVTFAYRVADQSFRRQRDTGSGYYRAHDVGDEVAIKFLPSRPQKFEYREGQTHSSAVMLQIFAGIAGLGGCFTLWRSGGKANSGVLARRYGRRTVATIESFTEIKNSGKPTGRGYMKFRTKDGLRGESLNGSIRQLRDLGAGTDIVVFVRGKDVWWEGDVGPRPEHQSDLPHVSKDDA